MIGLINFAQSKKDIEINHFDVIENTLELEFSIGWSNDSFKTVISLEEILLGLLKEGHITSFEEKDGELNLKIEDVDFDGHPSDYEDLDIDLHGLYDLLSTKGFESFMKTCVQAQCAQASKLFKDLNTVTANDFEDFNYLEKEVYFSLRVSPEMENWMSQIYSNLTNNNASKYLSGKTLDFVLHRRAS